MWGKEGGLRRFNLTSEFQKQTNNALVAKIDLQKCIISLMAKVKLNLGGRGGVRGFNRSKIFYNKNALYGFAKQGPRLGHKQKRQTA